MELTLETSEIEALYPFFLGLNQNGNVVVFGRSAPKCFPSIKIGIHFSELLKILVPRGFTENQDLSKLTGKILNLKSIANGITLNGEMLFSAKDKIFFFAITPVIQDSEILSKFNFSYSDFPAYSPVFDFLILTQAERFARQEQSKALRILEEQNSLAKLNLEIANFCSRCEDINEALVFVAESVQSYLGWKVTHRSERNLNPGIHVIGTHSIQLPLNFDRQQVHLIEFESETPFQSPELLRIFIGSLSFTLENFIIRINAQAIRVNSSKMYTLGEMAAGIAHELNNPLAVIQGVAWLVISKVKNGELGPTKIDEYMQKIVKMTDRSGKIINGLRIFARDAAQDPFEEINLETVINETLELCKSRISHRGIRLDMDLKGPYLAKGRAVQISQVLLNLINNASDAIEDLDQPWIRIRITRKDDFWKLCVTDSGKGIPSEIAEKMMAPFFTTKPPGKGTGLGLSISSGIMKSHGGDFWYDSENPNTTFCVTIPILHSPTTQS